MTTAIAPFDIVTRERRFQEKLARRKERLLASPPKNLQTDKDRRNATRWEAAVRDLESGKLPHAHVGESYDLSKIARESSEKGAIAEFISTGDNDSTFITRQRFEVERGRDMEPTLFEPIYDVTTDATLPRFVPIRGLGPAGVVFEEIKEGGEVKFASVGETSKTVEIKHYGVGLRYTEDVVLYNELWSINNLEEQFGVAHNALLNHIHFSPILDATYGAANQTAASSNGSGLAEKFVNTVEAAITTARQDSRRGPYWILCSSADLFFIQKAMMPEAQQGLAIQNPVLRSALRGIIAYDGWTGTRGMKEVTYGGVTAGKCYLVSTDYQMQDFKSFFKHQLRQQRGNGEPTRFIMEEYIWDVRFGVYAAPLGSVEEITLPTS